MKVLLSTGIGRLHLIKSAKSILEKNIDLYCIQGWVPRNTNSLLVRFICKILKRQSIKNGFDERNIPELKGRVFTCSFSEFFIQFLFLISKKINAITRDNVAVIGWKIFGWQSKKYLDGFDILHVRSGAGQGGVIKRAHEKGMKVLVDHSATHPLYMDEYLQEDFEKNNMKYEIGMQSFFWRLILKDCTDSDLLLVNSNFVRDTFVKYGFPYSKIRVAYCGVGENFYNLKISYSIEGPIKILFTGNCGIQKGVEYIFEALKELQKRKCNFEMTVVGTMDESLVYKYNIQKLNFVSHVPQTELKKYLKDADIYLFPSLGEGCANSGMEALATGLPVIATVQSGLPIEHEKTGLLIDAKNSKAIVDAVLRLSSNVELREKLGKNAALEMKTKYTWGKYAENVIAIYDELSSIR